MLMGDSESISSSPPANRPPVCQRCGREMTLTRIEPDVPGIDRRTFECECGSSETLLVRFK